MLNVLRKLFGRPSTMSRAPGHDHDPGLVDAPPRAADLRFPPAPAPALAPAHEPEAPAPSEAAAEAADALLVNVYATRAEFPQPAFAHVLHTARGLEDAELAPHLRAFADYVMAQGDGTMTATRWQVLQHLGRVQRHLSLSVPPAALDDFAAWCHDANAITLLPDGDVCDPTGRRLVGRGDGALDEGARLPWPAEALARRERIAAELAARGFAVSAGLPPRVGESELRLRTPRAVFGRAAALGVAAVRAESARDGDPLPADTLRERLPLAFEHLSPSERAFLEQDAPAPADIARFGWGYEAQAALQWALGLEEALPFPDRICDAAAVTRTLLSTGDAPPEDFTLRPAGELLDELDRCYRLQWLAREARRQGRPAPEGFREDVVQERHRALNWLVRHGDAEWDEVDTPT